MMLIYVHILNYLIKTNLNIPITTYIQHHHPVNTLTLFRNCANTVPKQYSVKDPTVIYKNLSKHLVRKYSNVYLNYFADTFVYNLYTYLVVRVYIKELLLLFYNLSRLHNLKILYISDTLLNSNNNFNIRLLKKKYILDVTRNYINYRGVDVVISSDYRINNLINNCILINLFQNLNGNKSFIINFLYLIKYKNSNTTYR